MNNYKLIMRSVNSNGQEAVTTVHGQDATCEDFLERCYQHFEEDIDAGNLNICEDEPAGFGTAGGFCSTADMWSFYENELDAKDRLLAFPW